MVAELQAAHISHGDLQHGNVLVVGDRLRLIDYDGMFVPALAGDMSREVGHRNYQHPARTEFDYGLYLDNFSAWVIYLSLVALSVHPELWSNHRGGDECLLFRKEDFLQPNSSALLRDINRSSNIQLRSLAQLFRSLLNFSPQDVPSLDGNHSSLTIAVVPVGSAPQKGSSWWDDHVERAPGTETPVQEPKEAGSPALAKPDFGWILESQDNLESLEPLRFKGSMKEPRIVLAGSCVLVIVTGLLVEMPAVMLIAACCGVFALNLLFCLLRYKNDPTVPEFAAFKKGFDDLLRQVRDHQAVADALSAERSQIHDKLAATEKEVGAAKARSQLALQTELNQAQAKLDSELQQLDQRRRDIVQVETSELQAVQRSLGDQVTGIDRKLNALTQQEADEKDKALKAFRQQELIKHLQRFTIENAYIKGIGPVLIRNLHYHGIATAADVDKLRRIRVSGIGHAKATALENWRNHLEASARTSTALALPLAEMGAISGRYRGQRNLLEAEKERLNTQLFSQVTSIRQKAATARQALNQEEQLAKNRIALEQSAIHQAHNAEVTALEKRVSTARFQASPSIAELSDKLRAAQKQIFALHWQSAKKEREGQRFSALRFPDYLKTVAGL